MTANSDARDRQNRSVQSFRQGKCICHRCLKERDEVRTFMILCPKCRNKRCPKASDHNLECTDSNLPGQPGSVYQ